MNYRAYTDSQSLLQELKVGLYTAQSSTANIPTQAIYLNMLVFFVPDPLWFYRICLLNACYMYWGQIK